jgi:hypothetical protein
MKLPSRPGAPDEIEDVTFLEDGAAVLFSVKSALLPERDIYRAKSRTAILDWLERFLLSQDKNFKGALVKLDAKITKLRAGGYEALGVSSNVRVFPILVTYEGLGEDVLFYRWIRKLCRERNLMSQERVAPVTFVDVEEFEILMSYVAHGRSLVGLLNKRKHNKPWFDRRIDQQLAGISPRVPRLPQIESMFRALIDQTLSSIRRPI